MGLFKVEEKSSIASIFDNKVSRDELQKQEYTAEVESQAVPLPEPVSESESESEEETKGTAKAAQTANPNAKDKSKKPEISEKQKQLQTAFFGNLNSTIITDKSAFKQFKEFARKAGPVSSIRFRSIAFSELLPRKAAYILQKLHPARDAVNAYVVYRSEDSVAKAVEMNGEVFLDHHVRVDSISEPTPHIRKRSVFLGNMDFEAKEEELYRHFEACGPIEYVRIVRDAATNVGKGFGYVQFKSPDAVPLAIMMNSTPFSGRPLRVTHCKLKTKVSSAPSEESQKKKPRKTARSTQYSKNQNNNTVIEGERAKEGQATSLRKRKPRHRSDNSRAKRTKPQK